MHDRISFFVTLVVELSLIYLAVVFLVGILQRSFDGDRIHAWLAPANPARAMFAAAGLGALVPFCSCSTVPLVAAMRKSGVAMPVLTTFLVMSPLVNPATLALLAGLVTPLYAALYLAGATVVALLVGAVVGRMHWTWAPTGATAHAPLVRLPWPERLRGGLQEAWQEYRKFAPILVVAAGVAALLQNQVAAQWLEGFLSQGDWWLIPVAAVVGVPIYASTAVLLPLGTTLYSAGAGIGVVSAFLMGATGLSVPEGIMLSKLLGVRFVLALAATFTLGVIGIAYGLEWLP